MIDSLSMQLIELIQTQILRINKNQKILSVIINLNNWNLNGDLFHWLDIVTSTLL